MSWSKLNPAMLVAISLMTYGCFEKEDTGTAITTPDDEICDDGLDNDLDGLTDEEDDDCPQADPEICDDDLDNDLDGLVDCDDSDCTEECQVPEDEICDDDIDNDLDGRVDCMDPDCTEECQQPEDEICDDHRDNDGDSLVDCDDPDCAEECVEPEVEICDDDMDNDGDGLVDCDDPQCRRDPACTVDYFDAVWLLPSAEFGLQDGAVTSYSISGTEYEPRLYLVLAEEEYPDAWDDRYTCDLVYTFTGSPGTAAVGAIYDIVLNLTADPVLSTCDNLDPAIFPDAHAYFETWGWEFTLDEPDADVLSFFAGYDEYLPGLLGSTLYLDGVAAYEAQTNYAILYEVDGSMAISGELGSAAAVTAGGDAMVSLGSLYLWGL